MLSEDDAIALVDASRFFDERWYADQVGVAFASRTEAVTHWVRSAPDGASPHPRFEPVWLYPTGRWRRGAPDPLSFWLADDEEQERRPHPVDEPAPPVPRSPVTDVVVGLAVERRTLRVAVRWLRHLDRLDAPAVTTSVTTEDGAVRRVLTSVVASLPSARLDSPVPESPGQVVVTVDPAVVRPPRWPWLAPLLAALDAPGVAAARPLLLRDDHTVAAPLLVGHPVQDAERLDGLALPAEHPGIVARRADAAGETVLAAGARLFGPDVPAEGDAWAPLWLAAGFAAPRVPLTVREGRRVLRWSIDVAAPAGPIGRRWGDWSFARSLADALERRGQWVAIDHPETRARASRELDDVVLTLRGLHAVPPTPDAVNLLWVISHPASVTADELRAYDAAWAAGPAWAARHDVPALLQCTDTTRFHPGLETSGTPEPDGPVLFVGNARDGGRPVVDAAVAAGVRVTVIGTGWRDAPGVTVEAEAIANADLPARYAAAGVVLADHWADMREEGFVANRVLDALAVGARLVVDDVAGLTVTVGADVPVWRTPADLARLCRPPYDGFGDAEARRALAERVVAVHSFDARAATLLEAALRLVDSRP